MRFKRSRLIFFLGVFFTGLTVAVFPAAAGEIFPRVQSNGVVRCGVSEGIAGFSIKDVSGRWTGLDADFCRAVAAAEAGHTVVPRG